MRILVFGGRTYFGRAKVYAALDAFASLYRSIEVVEGGALGADRWAQDWAVANAGGRCSRLITEEAQWTDLSTPPVVLRFRRDGSAYNAAAGGIRNARMLELHRPDFGLAYPGGRGTADMIARAKAFKLPLLDGETLQPI